MTDRLRLPAPAFVGRATLILATALVVLALPATALAKPVRLFVDPGHGGKDPGAVSGGLAEADSNLRISKLVAKSAKRQGWDVKMSRDKDVFIPLEQRAAKANKWKADAFVSIHSNSTGKKALGNMTIYRSKSGRKLGNEIMKEMKPLTKHKDIGNRKDVRNLTVLRKSKPTAVLVEVVSVSAAKERKALKDPKFQRAVAEAIVKGIAKHEKVDYVPPAKPKPKAEAKRASEKALEKRVAPKLEVTPKSPAEKPSAETTPGGAEDADSPNPSSQATRAAETSESSAKRDGPDASSAAPGTISWLGSLLRMLVE